METEQAMHKKHNFLVFNWEQECYAYIPNMHKPPTLPENV